VSSKPWFWLWNEAAHDPKLNALSDAEFRLWFRLLCLASDSDERFVLNEKMPLLSVLTYMPEADIRSGLARLTALDLVHMDGQRIIFHNAEKRNGGSRSPSASPERVRARVQKHRECNDPVTGVTTCNDHSRKREEQNIAKKKEISAMRPASFPECMRQEITLDDQTLPASTHVWLAAQKLWPHISPSNTDGAVLVGLFCDGCLPECKQSLQQVEDCTALFVSQSRSGKLDGGFGYKKGLLRKMMAEDRRMVD